MGIDQVPQFPHMEGLVPFPEFGQMAAFGNLDDSMMFPQNETFWLADARSVVYLDLSACEYHKPRDISLSALDLCIRFRKEDPIVPDGPLIKIFNRVTNTIMTLSLQAKSATFFKDINRIMLGKLTINLETETLKLYMKLLKAYNQYIKESLFPVSYFLSDEFITFRLLYRKENRLIFQDFLMSEPAEKLKNLLFKNNYTDSSLVAEFVRTVCVSCNMKKHIFLGDDIRKTEYLLNRLKEKDCDMGIWMQDCFSEHGFQCHIREKPQCLLMFLNYGYKITFNSRTHLKGIKSLFFCAQFGINYFMSHKDEDFLQRSIPQQRQRESLILQLFQTFDLYCDSDFSSIEDYLESIRISWRSIPEAFVTYTEMKRVVLRILDNDDSDCNEDVEDTCNCFQNYCNSQSKNDDIFQPQNDVLQPRRLSHYSRCVIRDMLSSNSQMPEGIALLNLRDDLQSYLRLEC